MMSLSATTMIAQDTSSQSKLTVTIWNVVNNDYKAHREIRFNFLAIPAADMLEVWTELKSLLESFGIEIAYINDKLQVVVVVDTVTLSKIRNDLRHSSIKVQWNDYSR